MYENYNTERPWGFIAQSPRPYQGNPHGNSHTTAAQLCKQVSASSALTQNRARLSTAHSKKDAAFTDRYILPAHDCNATLSANMPVAKGSVRKCVTVKWQKSDFLLISAAQHVSQTMPTAGSSQLVPSTLQFYQKQTETIIHI